MLQQKPPHVALFSHVLHVEMEWNLRSYTILTMPNFENVIFSKILKFPFPGRLTTFCRLLFIRLFNPLGSKAGQQGVCRSASIISGESLQICIRNFPFPSRGISCTFSRMTSTAPILARRRLIRVCPSTRVKHDVGT